MPLFFRIYFVPAQRTEKYIMWKVKLIENSNKKSLKYNSRNKFVIKYGSVKLVLLKKKKSYHALFGHVIF